MSEIFSCLKTIYSFNFICEIRVLITRIAQNDASHVFGGTIPSFIYLKFRRQNANAQLRDFLGNKFDNSSPIL